VSLSAAIEAKEHAAGAGLLAKSALPGQQLTLGFTVTGVTVDSAAKTIIIAFSASSLIVGGIIEFSWSDPTVGNDANAIPGNGRHRCGHLQR
jgi:hypothetical protein